MPLLCGRVEFCRWPVKQYVDEKSTAAFYSIIRRDGTFLLYEDDGKSFNYRHGDGWNQTVLGRQPPRLSLQLAADRG